MADFQFETNSFVWKFNQLTSLGVNANLTFKRVDGKLLVNLEAALSQNYPQQLLAEPQFGMKGYCPYIIPALRSRRRKAQTEPRLKL